MYTSTYTVPMQRMLLAVAVDNVTAGRNVDALPSKLPGSFPLTRLGERTQATPNGTVEVLKDNQILIVGRTGLPAVFCREGQRRTDLAYEISPSEPACWSGCG